MARKARGKRIKGSKLYPEPKKVVTDPIQLRAGYLWEDNAANRKLFDKYSSGLTFEDLIAPYDILPSYASIVGCDEYKAAAGEVVMWRELLDFHGYTVGLPPTDTEVETVEYAGTKPKTLLALAETAQAKGKAYEVLKTWNGEDRGWLMGELKADIDTDTAKAELWRLCCSFPYRVNKRMGCRAWTEKMIDDSFNPTELNLNVYTLKDCYIQYSKNPNGLEFKGITPNDMGIIRIRVQLKESIDNAYRMLDYLNTGETND